MKSRLLALTVAIALALIVAVPVLAHGVLLRSIPNSNAALPNSPVQIELFYNEALDPTFSSVTVLDSTGNPVDNNDSRVNPNDSTHLTVSMRSLPDGIYTVSWKVLSAIDGHVTTGAFPFAVGNVDAAALAAADQASKQIKISIGEIVGRWLIYLSIATLLGGPLFVLLVWQPAFRSAHSDTVKFSSPWKTLAALALILLIGGNVVALLTQAGQASGADIAAPWSNVTTNVLFNTRFGALWIVRLALAFALAALLVQTSSTRERWIAIGLGVLLTLTISLGSHAAAEAQPFLPVVADTLHLLAASVWVGGLTHFVAGLWAARQLEPKFRTQLTALLIPRFSALALIGVGVLTLTGLYSASLRLGTWEALNNTFYGRILIIKLTIALPMIALGAVNLLGITPAMKQAAAAQGNDSLVSRFRNLITSEITLGIGLLISVGLLTSTPSPQVSAAIPALIDSQTVDDLQIDLDITPGRVGLNTFALTLTSDNQPVFNTNAVLLRFTPASGKLPPSEVTLSAQGGGQYTLKGSNLSLPDNWQVQAVVRRTGKFDAYANFNFAVGSTAVQSYPWHRIAGGLLLAGALAYLFAFSSLGQTQSQLIGFGVVPALALAIVSVIVFYQAPTLTNVNTELINPIPPNPDSIAKGQALFTTNCVPCHGERGLGDGPVGLTLSPRPADLQQHAIPGVHADGQLYLWVSDGFAGSVMPSFRGALTEDERWHLVNFIRTLAPK